MSNDYWNNLVALVRRTNARAEAVNSILGAIKAGFDLFPSKARLYEERVSYCVDTGLANAYILTPTYALTLTDGARVSFRALATNSGPSTANVYSLGNVSITNYAGAALGGGEIVAGAFTEMRYSSASTKWQIINPVTAVASVSVNNNVKASTTDTTPATLFAKIFNYIALKNPSGNEQVVLGGMVTSADTSPNHLTTKLVPIGAIKTRTLAAAAAEVLQLKLMSDTILTATGSTVAVGSITPVDTSGGAIANINLPAAGTGDTALQDGDTVALIDTGGSIETNNVTTITGNAGNIVFMGQSAAATLNWNGPNFSMLVFRWKTSTSQWIGNGFD